MTTNVNPLSNAQLHQLQVMLDNDDISSFYQFLLARNYNYAGWAQGVAAEDSIAGIAAVQYMKGTANTGVQKDAGDKLTATQIGSIKLGMAQGYLNALVTISNSELDGTVHRDISASEMESFHKEVFAANNMSIENWTLYSVFEIVRRTEGQYGVESLWSDLSSTRGDGIDATLANFAVLLEMQQWSKSTDPVISELAEYWLKHVPGVFGLDQWLNSVQTLAIFGQSEIVSSQLALYEIVTSSETVFNPLAVMHLSFTAATMWRPALRDPLILDLDHDGLETTGLTENLVMFDHDGDGVKAASGWIKADDAFLVMDRNNNGTVDNGTELFGDATRLYTGGSAKDGFEALAQEDTNNDGKIDDLDKNWEKLSIWSDKNQDGISQSEEIKNVSEAGIVEISIIKIANNQVLGNGNVIADLGSFKTTDGLSNTLGGAANMGDVNLAEDPFYTRFTESVPISQAIKNLPNMQGSGQARNLLEAATLSTRVGELLSQFSTESSKKNQLEILELLVDAWADSSSMAVNLQSRVSSNYEVIYQNLGEKSAGAYSETEWDQIVGSLERKIHTLEVFNGKYFFHLPSDTAGSGSVAGLTIGETLASGKAEIKVSLSSDQMQLIDSAYTQLSQEIYPLLALQTRLNSYLKLVEVKIIPGGVALDFSLLNQEIENQLLQQPELAIPDIADLINFSPSSWHYHGWDGVRILGDYLNNKSITPELKALLNFDKIAVGTLSTDFISTAHAVSNIFALDGDDTITDGGGSDYIDGGAGDDSITDRGIGTNILRGGDGNDTISFDSLANNTIEGGSGSDIIKVNNTSSRSSATSTLSGGAGNDTITGGLEADIYLFNRGDGYDIIREDGGSYTIDKLVFGTGIARNDLTFSRVGNDLVIKIADAAQATATDQVTMQSWYSADYFQVEQLVLADGTMLSAAQATSLGVAIINGTEGVDILNGSTDDTVINGFSGNDTINDGGGSDVIDGGAGDDSITDRGIGTNILRGGDGNDTISFDNLANNTIEGGSGSDIIKVNNTSSRSSATSTLSGGAGNDTITGGLEADIYLFNRGDGYDIIREDGGSYTIDKLVFGTGIARNDLMFSRVGDDLVIKIADAAQATVTDQVTMQSWYSADYFQVEQLVLADGTMLSAAQATSLGVAIINGTEGVDILNGSTDDTVINGFSGNDTINDGGGSDVIDGGAGDDSITDRGIGTNILRGGDGNDTISFDNLANNTIEGGSGSDIIKVNNTSSRSSATSTLSGGAGNDTITGGLEADIYLFNRGDGYDIIREDGGSYTIDKLVFGTGIARNDLTFSRVGNDLVIKIADAAQATATDQVTMQSWYSADYFQVEQLVLADGTMLSAAQATSLGVAIINGTEGVDILNGSTDDTVINGFSGNDTINDGGGSDVIDGGAGDDSITDRGIGTNILRGGDGNDTISFDNLANNTIEGGSGSDIIKVNNTSSRSSATSTLSGGAGNDTITGGLEADIYLFNRGDGYDIIREDGGSYTIDKLVFGTGIARNDLTFSRLGNDLVIKIADAAQATATDQVTMQSWYSADYFQVEQLVLADGTMLSAAQATSLGVAIINGTEGVDILNGSTDDTVINGFSGNDTINDGGGSDVIDGGAGDDSITDRGIGTNILRGGDGNDTISFDNLANNTIEGGSGSDIIKVNNTSSRSSATSTLSGGAGNDTITGGLEADIYLFNRGDGYDIIREDGGSYTIDKLVFGTGIARNDLTFSRLGNDLVIKIADAAQATATDQVTMQSWYSADYFQVEQLVLADGTMLSAAQATSLGVAIINGTEGVDILNGSTDDTVINGFSGNDTINDGGGSDVIDGGAGDDSITDRGIGTNILRGGDGNDTISFDNLANNTIEGGSGSDIIKVNNTSSRSSATSTLSGGAGNDTITGGLEADIYLFNRGDGYDIIREDGGSYTIDKLVFGTGIARNDLMFSRVGDDLVIKIADAAQATVADQVTMQSWYTADYFQVEQLVLADGTMLSATEAISLVGVAATTI